MFEISGTVKRIFPEQTFESGFNKREFVLTTENDKYPQDIKFECHKDRVELINGLKPGEPVQVRFNINGREWNERYFVNLIAFDVKSSGNSRSGQTAPFDPSDEILDEEPLS